MYKFIYALPLLFLNCGGPDPQNNSIHPNVNVIFKGNLNFTVKADEHLPDNRKIAIFEALNEWSEKTNYTFTYNMQFVDMSKEERILESRKTIKIFVGDAGTNEVGVTTSEAIRLSAFIIMTPGLKDNDFRRVMLHELGHAFNLSFNGNRHYDGPAKSIMVHNLGGDSQNLECPEITNFCNIYGCPVNCVFNEISHL